MRIIVFIVITKHVTKMGLLWLSAWGYSSSWQGRHSRGDQGRRPIVPAVRNQNEMRTQVTSLLSVTFLFTMGSWTLGCCCQHSGCIFPAQLTSTPRLHTPHPSATGVGMKAAEQLHQPALISAGKGDIQGQQGQHASSELKVS